MQPKKFYYWLDPLRALSALLVLFVHVRCIIYPLFDELNSDSQNFFTILFFSLCSLGGFAVCMFYILSGFLVGGRTIEKTRDNRFSAKQFIIDRIFRICVPLTGALILIVIVNYSLGLGVNYIELFGQYTGLQCVLFNDYGGVFWTLPYEIWFYILLLGIMLIVRKNRGVLAGCFFLALSIIVFCKLLPSFLYILAFGVMGYFLQSYKISKKYINLLWGLFIILFLADRFVSIHSLVIKIGIYHIAKNLHLIFNTFMFAVIGILVSQYVNQKPKIWISKRINTIGNFLASFSYSLFLTHYQVLKIWEHRLPKLYEINIITILIFIGVCITCILVAYLFYWVFERNTLFIQRSFERLIGLNNRKA